MAENAKRFDAREIERSLWGCSLIAAPALFGLSTFFWIRADGRAEYGATGGALIAIPTVFWIPGVRAVAPDAPRRLGAISHGVQRGPLLARPPVSVESAGSWRDAGSHAIRPAVGRPVPLRVRPCLSGQQSPARGARGPCGGRPVAPAARIYRLGVSDPAQARLGWPHRRQPPGTRRVAGPSINWPDCYTRTGPLQGPPGRSDLKATYHRPKFTWDASFPAAITSARSRHESPRPCVPRGRDVVDDVLGIPPHTSQ